MIKMAEKEKKDKVEDVKVEEVKETETKTEVVEESSSDVAKELSEAAKIMEAWKPKTELGRKIKSGEYLDYYKKHYNL